MNEKTESVIVALKAAKAYVKEAKTLKDAESQIDGLLLVANATKDVEEREETNAKIKYEQVTISVPKLVRAFLEKTTGNAVAWIERIVVENAAAEIESMGPVEWADLFNLTPVFREILGEAYYKTED